MLFLSFSRENERQAADEWQKANPKAALAQNRDQYLRQLDGLVFGEDPRRGYVSG
jgi:predicted Zn-dependent protease